jgi:AcrR family transcriptional regulator
MSAASAPRRPRADAQRNRERLIDAAKTAFAELGAEVSLEEIARRADVGIGTLYRHFPTRDAVIEAVYRREVDQLADAAGSLLKDHAPADALARWMKLSVDYMATKKLIAPVLGSFTGGASALFAQSGARLIGALGELLQAARASGDIRADVRDDDIAQAFGGFAYNSATPGWRDSAYRLIDIIVAGIRTPRA